MKVLYNIGIRAYSLSVLSAGLFGNKKAVDWVEGRKNWKKNVTDFRAKYPKDNLIWIHASSLGEYEQVKPFMEYFKTSHPDYKIVLTFFSPSGYNYVNDNPYIDAKIYLPIDTTSNARYFLDTLKPHLALFVKYDFWFNFLKELQRLSIPTVYFSSKFRDGQFYFKKGMKWQLDIMKKINCIQTQDEKSCFLLKSKGFTNVKVGGDTRFDTVWTNKDNFNDISEIHQFKGSHSLFVLGSSWPEEEKLVATVKDEIIKLGFKLCIAPHDISINHVSVVKSLFPDAILFSEVKKGKNVSDKNILVIDNIGILKSIYFYSDIAFVGGGFKNSLHNILEPSVFSNVILFGSNHSKFPEADEIIKAEGAFEINDSAELLSFFETIATNQSELEVIQKNSFNYVKNNKGATDKLLKTVEGLLNPV